MRRGPVDSGLVYRSLNLPWLAYVLTSEFLLLQCETWRDLKR